MWIASPRRVEISLIFLLWDEMREDDELRNLLCHLMLLTMIRIVRNKKIIFFTTEFYICWFLNNSLLNSIFLLYLNTQQFYDMHNLVTAIYSFNVVDHTNYSSTNLLNAQGWGNSTNCFANHLTILCIGDPTTWSLSDPSFLDCCKSFERVGL